LEAWAVRVAARRGAKRAKVALARRLAVILRLVLLPKTEGHSPKARLVVTITEIRS
jgi:hypothetical protein